MNNYKHIYEWQYILLFEYCDAYKCTPGKAAVYKQWAIGEWYHNLKKKIINRDKYYDIIHSKLEEIKLLRKIWLNISIYKICDNLHKQFYI